MRRFIHDIVLKKIENNIPLEAGEKKIIQELLQKGLLRKYARNSYALTPYGQRILIMGYRTHEKTEEFEKKLPRYTPSKIKKRTYFLLSLLVVLLTFLIWEFRNLLFLFYLK